MQFKVKKEGVPAISLSLGNGITGDANGGLVIDKLFDVASQTKDTKYLYDLQVTHINGDVKTYIEGTINVIQDVSRV